MASIAEPFRYAFASPGSTSGSFSARNATSTEPSGDGIIDLESEQLGAGWHGKVPAYLLLVPFGTGANNDTFDMRVYGYSATIPTDLVTDTKLYIPQLLCDVSATMSAITFSDYAADTFLVDTLTLNDGATDNGPWLSIVSPAEDMVGNIIIHTRGCRYIRFEFDLLVTPTHANCMWRPIEF